ncbi:MAG: hypothetical protein H7246_14450, partial [Phycisphaerae bacterium]|nr:hypothetical protein [Saprospiraceae bacterium]
MKNILLLLILSLLSIAANGQAVSWELSAEPGNQVSNPATFQSSNFANCTLSRGAGITATTGAGSMNSSGWFSGSSSTTLADAIANNDYYEFSINTINCNFFNPTTLKMVLRSSATGPNTVTLRCSSDGFVSDIGTGTVGTTSKLFSFSESLSPNAQSVIYRLYGYGGAAGGGNPASGGTMRVGTSVVASDNDLEAFATTTLLSVSSVSNITVTDGDAVPSTVFTANVPGATINWTRTSENIGLGATSGTGNVPAFTAYNASGIPVTSTFTVNATIGNCQSQNMIFTITVNPAPCTITVDFFGNPSPCDDNGTPNDLSDDFFTQNIHASFFNRPFTGSLQIVPGGDQIGVYSIPANQIVGNAHTFNAVKLKADGTPSVVQMNFTDNPTCIDADTGPTVQPCSTPPPPCTITVDFFGNPSACNDNGTPNDPSDDFFTQNIHASFFNRPFTGSLQIVPGGDQIGAYSIPANQIVGNAHTFNGVMLKADGTPSVVQMNFTDEPGCIDAETGPTIQPCSTPQPPPPNDLCANAIPIPCNSSIDGTTVSATPDFGLPNCGFGDVASPGVWYSFVGNGSPAMVSLCGGITDFNSRIKVYTGGCSTPICHANGGGVTPSCNGFSVDEFQFNTTAGTPYLINVEGASPTGTGNFTLELLCFSPPVLTCPSAASVSCANEVPAVNTASVSETHDCPGNVTISHLSDVNSNVVCINRLTITRTYKGTDQCGQTATCSQTITINDQTPPTVACPGPLALSCASQVPAVDVNLLGVTDNCAGGVGISRSFVGEVTSNQACTNRFTLTRTYRGGDACGNTATCTQVITVNDQTKPTMTCPGNVTVSCASQVPAANIASVTGVGDNCGGAVTITNFPQDAISNQTCANRFTILRSYFAIDVCGNSNNCSQTITVNDQTSPTISCPAPQTVSCAEQVPAPNPALVTGSDNCGGTITPSFFSDAVSNQTCANRFTLTRQYRAADACGNTSSCNQIITVNDQTPPVFTSVPANVTVDCYLLPGIDILTASDNCTSGATVTFLGEVNVPGVCPIFKILTRSWRATDACGNSATASQVVTVTDYNAPQFLVLPKNKIVECGPNNAAEFQAFIVNRGGAVVEDCAQNSYTHADAPFQSNYFDCGNTFHKNIRFFATDECGNVSFRDASFTVVDQTPPLFSTPPQSVDIECDASGDNGENAFYDWLDSNAGLVAEDNCGDVELEKIQVSEYAGCGNTWRKTYEFRAKDACGNISKTTATFAVVDHTPPTVDCPANDNLFLLCVEDVPAADPTVISVHDCNGVTTTLTDTWTNGTGCPGWPMTVAYRYTATDGCGNQAICERAFYVEETTAPTLVCPDTIQLICVNDIPGPAQLFGAIKNQLLGNCTAGFS